MPTAQKPALLTLPQIEYWETFSTTCIRRLLPLRAMPEARASIKGWVETLRDCKRVRAYRNW